MFRIEYLHITGHPQLGNVKVGLCDNDNLNPTTKPYTSVIIGPNGTGKSYILRAIAEIFRQFNEYVEYGKSQIGINYFFHIRYHIGINCYEITSKILQAVSRDRQSKQYRFFKNRPLDQYYNIESFPFDQKTEFDIDLKELEFPNSLLAVSLLHNDRFIFKNSNVNDFYQYLGLRSSSGSTSTKSAQKKAIKNIFGVAASNQAFIYNLENLLNFLNFEKVFKVQYTTRYNNLFFSGSLDEKDFRKFYEQWWDEDFKFSSRKQDNPPWSKAYYDKNFKENSERTKDIINYLNKLAKDGKRLKKRPNASSKTFTVDFLQEDIPPYELDLIQQLESLDILELVGIKIKKVDKEFSTNEISSGESSMLLSVINIFSRIQKNSLILIDEPEISLHPNWQMQYMSFLKKAFSNFSNCHFIITTHSHFIVSDLEGKSSSITTLSRSKEDETKIDAKILENKNTFGWSAEEVLLEVFRTPTTRNYYISDKIGEILSLISKREKNYDLISKKISELNEKNMFTLSEVDPLYSLWEKIKSKYG